MVALKQVVELEVVIMDYQYSNQATIEVPFIGMQDANSLRVVSIGCANFSSSFVGWAKMIGNSKAIVVVVDSFSQHYSNQVEDMMLEDLGNSGFAIDYHRNLNFARGPKAYLDVGPMVSIEQQRLLAHHLHLS